MNILRSTEEVSFQWPLKMAMIPWMIPESGLILTNKVEHFKKKRGWHLKGRSRIFMDRGKI